MPSLTRIRRFEPLRARASLRFRQRSLFRSHLDRGDMHRRSPVERAAAPRRPTIENPSFRPALRHDGLRAGLAGLECGHCLSEIAEGLLLDCLGACGQPRMLGAGGGELPTLLKVAGGVLAVTGGASGIGLAAARLAGRPRRSRGRAGPGRRIQGRQRKHRPLPGPGRRDRGRRGPRAAVTEGRAGPRATSTSVVNNAGIGAAGTVEDKPTTPNGTGCST